jgi:hypothetical protein
MFILLHLLTGALRLHAGLHKIKSCQHTVKQHVLVVMQSGTLSCMPLYVR